MKNLTELNLSNKKYIIFDMDGTLIDSIGVWNTTYQKLIKLTTGKEIDIEEINYERDLFLKTHTSSDIYLEYCQYLIDKYEINLDMQSLLDLRWQISGDILIKEMDFKPYAVDVLKKFKERGCILVIASATTKRQIDIYSNKNEKMKNQLQIDKFFDLIITKEFVTKKKPDPEIYLNILKHFNAQPEECLVFEDSLIGVTASTTAGLETVIVYDKYADCDRCEIEKLGTYKIDSYKEFLKIM